MHVEYMTIAILRLFCTWFILCLYSRGVAIFIQPCMCSKHFLYVSFLFWHIRPCAIFSSWIRISRPLVQSERGTYSTKGMYVMAAHISVLLSIKRGNRTIFLLLSCHIHQAQQSPRQAGSNYMSDLDFFFKQRKTKTTAGAFLTLISCQQLESLTRL